ncbi:MAG: hypothetical protein FIB06_12130 [Betaproteobacteria bacterium]|nr:hypothetical protein [Betaproteobacteria bacterium]
MQRQPRSGTPSRTAARHHVARPEYTAAVRYLDGRSEIFHVRNANGLADAREVVLGELDDVFSILIARRH